MASVSSKSNRLKGYTKSILHRSGSKPLFTTSTSAKENARSAWHGFKLASQSLEKFLDGTPFKIPVGVLNTVISIADSIVNNRESMAIVLMPIGQRLEIVSLALEKKPRPRGIDSASVERFSRTLQDAKDELQKMSDQGLLERIAKSSEHPRQIEDIFRKIDEATKNFDLELSLAIAKEVEGILLHTEVLRLRDLNPSHEARYAMVQREPCVEGTREAIIESIMSWSRELSSDSAPIFWLSGMAGTGKSTIAYTICEKLYKDQRLGASFFCSQQIMSCRLRQNIVPTIVHDLALNLPEYGRELLSSRFDAQPPPLKDHIRSMLSDPWRSVVACQCLPPLVVVIDALDEIERREGSNFLEELIEEITQHRDEFQGLKFLVTSRQDPRIVSVCTPFDPNAVCRLEEIPVDIVEQDINLYLHTALPDLDESQLRILALQASGLFIYAATAAAISVIF